MSKLKGKVIKAIQVRKTDFDRLIGHSLRKLREIAGLTQADLAERLKVGQASVSKIECRGDVQISSLQRYVEALGATLRVEAIFGPRSARDLRVGDIFDGESHDENQLVFPLF